jgi:glycosyltransferase involved in cell wall biosynthesis
MIQLQELALVVSQGWFDNDPRHNLWSSTLRTAGWRVVEVEIVDEPRGFRDLVGAEVRGDRITVRVDRVAGYVDHMIPVRSSTGRFVRSLDGVVLRGMAVVKSMGFSPRLVIANDLYVGRGVVREWPASTVVYDAHESFVASFDMLDTQPLTGDERLFWRCAEREVMSRSALTVTVSPGLANYHVETIGLGSLIVPNYFPLHLGKISDTLRSGPARFVFVGRFDPHRGIGKLVDSWNVDPSVATLDIYMPDAPGSSSLKKLAGSDPARPRFRAKVDASRIIETVASYDVGVIPYDYPFPYSEASPNKFGEYLAAGVALMANRQGFTAGVIERFGLGEVFDWRDRASFVLAIQRLSDREHLMNIRRNVRQAFESDLNWDLAVQPIFVKLEGICPVRESREVGEVTNVHTYSERLGISLALRSWVIRAGLGLVRRSGVARRLVSRLLSLVTRFGRLPEQVGLRARP